MQEGQDARCLVENVGFAFLQSSNRLDQPVRSANAGKWTRTYGDLSAGFSRTWGLTVFSSPALGRQCPHYSGVLVVCRWINGVLWYVWLGIEAVVGVEWRKRNVTRDGLRSVVCAFMSLASKFLPDFCPYPLLEFHASLSKHIFNGR